MRRRTIIQRIFYRSVYVLIYIILVGLLLITPADIIDRSRRQGQRYNILVLALAYAATIVMLGFIYAIRLYMNKTALAAIPKSWIPIDRGDVKERVHKMICTGLNRSAAVTFLSRPRDRSVADMSASHENLFAQPRIPMKTAKTVGLELGLLLPAKGTSWLGIEQPGWASPDSPDLPNLQYSTVLSELPNLIEGKVLTLAPRDPATLDTEQEQLDQDAVALLQRDPTMSLRKYLDTLAELGMLDAGWQTTSDFLTEYERARFSTSPLINSDFRHLMHLFAELLRNMTPPNLGGDEAAAPAAAAAAAAVVSTRRRGLGPAPFESDNDSDAPLASRPTTPRSRISRSINSGNEGDYDDDDMPTRLPLPRRNSSFNAWSQYATAPNTPGSRHTGMMSRRRSNNSLATTRHGTPLSRRLQDGPLLMTQRSNASLRSSGSDSSRSVIRLATHEDSSALPYILSLRPTAD